MTQRGPKTKVRERDARIRAWWPADRQMTLQSMGDELGLTRERVRQIGVSLGLPKRSGNSQASVIAGLPPWVLAVCSPQDLQVLTGVRWKKAASVAPQSAPLRLRCKVRIAISLRSRGLTWIDVASLAGYSSGRCACFCVHRRMKLDGAVKAAAIGP